VSNFFGPSAGWSVAQVDSAFRSYLQTYATLSPVSKNGSTLPRENVIFVVLVHDLTEATAAQVEQMWKTVIADGRYWPTSLGEALDYRRRAFGQRLNVVSR
jgi:hypothetical protein